MKVILYTDGGAIKNPGPAAIGVVLQYQKSKIKYQKYIGQATNNQAEYQALIFGLEQAKKIKADEVDCYLDSELAVKQLNHQYKIKNPDLGKFFIKIWNLSQKFRKVNFFYIPREKNKEADKLVRNALSKFTLID